MYCLYVIDNVGWGRKLSMGKDGYWINAKINPMLFGSGEEAMKYVWEESPYRIYGGEYYVEEVME